MSENAAAGPRASKKTSPSSAVPSKQSADAAGSESKVVTLPLSRVKTIMKSSPDVSNISQESLFLVAKAAELFVDHLTLKALERSPDKTNVEYRALADFVNGEDTMQFLQDIIPHKIKFGDYLKLMEGDSDCEVISSSSDDSDNDDDSDDDVIPVTKDS